MALRKIAAAAALAALATPAAAFDVREAGASTMFYISIPLDFGGSSRKQPWSAGLQLQGKGTSPALTLDSRLLNFVSDGSVDGKWIIAGLVAVGAAAAIGSKDRKTSETLQQEQTQIEQQPPGGGGTCTRPPTDPCAR